MELNQLLGGLLLAVLTVFVLALSRPRPESDDLPNTQRITPGRARDLEAHYDAANDAYRAAAQAYQRGEMDLDAAHRELDIAQGGTRARLEREAQIRAQQRANVERVLSDPKRKPLRKPVREER